MRIQQGGFAFGRTAIAGTILAARHHEIWQLNPRPFVLYENVFKRLCNPRIFKGSWVLTAMRRNSRGRSKRFCWPQRSPLRSAIAAGSNASARDLYNSPQSGDAVRTYRPRARNPRRPYAGTERASSGLSVGIRLSTTPVLHHILLLRRRQFSTKCRNVKAATKPPVSTSEGGHP